MKIFDSFDYDYENRLGKWLSDYVGMENFRPGLDRLQDCFCETINKLEVSGAKVVTIGGTNGKGEVAQCLSQILTKREKKVGLWISPHVLSVRERFSFDGELIDYGELESSMRKCRGQLDGINLSYYEFLFYVFLHLVLNKLVDVVILEVGLGGRFDAVNLLTPHLTAVTSISRDHQAILGNSYREILKEKLGITRPSVELVTSFELEYLRNITQVYCDREGIPWKDLLKLKLIKKSDPYHIRNRILAQMLAQSIIGPDEGISNRDQLIGEARRSDWPIYKGRFEMVTIESIRFIFIGAHNLDGIRKMIRALWYKNEYEGVKVPIDVLLLSFSKRPSSEIETMIGALSGKGDKRGPMAKSIILTKFDHGKAMDLGIEFEKKGMVEFVEDWKSYIKNIIKVESGPKTILVSGSYYFIGHVQTYLQADSLN